MQLLCTGIGSTIIQAVKDVRPDLRIARLGKRSDEVFDFTEAEPGLRIILAAGYLAGKSDAEHTDVTREETMSVNYLQPLNICEQALAEVPGVRICVIGSQSAVAGSYDTQYAMAKAMMHRWVNKQRVQPPQQLLAVAPPIIADSGMTRRRHDYPEVLKNRPHCMAAEVAQVIVRALFTEEPKPGVNSNTVLFVPATRNRGLPL